MDLRLNADTHDLELVNYDLALTSDIDLMVQRLKQSLWFFLGEWYLDITDGVPYYEEILVKAPAQVTVEGILKAAILETPDVTGLLNFKFEYDNQQRTLSLAFTAATTYGNASVNINI